MTLPTSSASPSRPRAVRATIGGMTSGIRVNASCEIRVRVGPGATELTRIRRPLNSLAIYRVSTVIPAFMLA